MTSWKITSKGYHNKTRMTSSMHIHHMYTQTHRKDRQSNITQHKTRDNFSQTLKWDLNSFFTHSRCDALPTELLRQLTWLSSIQTKHLNLINRWVSITKKAGIIKPPKMPISIPSDIHKQLKKKAIQHRRVLQANIILHCKSTGCRLTHCFSISAADNANHLTFQTSSPWMLSTSKLCIHN